jgi:hypothetical protein
VVGLKRTPGTVSQRTWLCSMCRLCPAGSALLRQWRHSTVLTVLLTGIRNEIKSTPAECMKESLHQTSQEREEPE